MRKSGIFQEVCNGVSLKKNYYDNDEEQNSK